MRFAYIMEFYPQHGEAWIRYEMEELLARGHDVRVYATRTSLVQSRGSSAPHLSHKIVYVNKLLPLQATTGLTRLRPVTPLMKQLLQERQGLRWILRVSRALYQASLAIKDFTEFRPDLTVCHFAANRSLLGCILSEAVQKPFITIMHAADVWTRDPGLRVYVEAAEEVWTISNYNREYLINHYSDVNWSKLRVVRTGVSLAEFPFSPERPGDPKQILFIGRLIPMKGTDTLLRACALLKREGWKFEVVFLGSGPLLATLKELSRNLGIHEIVSFLGNVPTSIVSEQLRTASVLVLPCRLALDQDGTMDGIPNVLKEAMAAGTPVVTTSISGMPELVVDGKNGILVEPDNAEDLANGIARVWRMDTDRRLALITNARETVESMYDVRIIVDQIVKAAMLHR